MRLIYDSLAVFSEFLVSEARWPKPVDATNFVPTKHVDFIIENRFHSVLQEQGLLRFLFTLPRTVALTFLQKSNWRPSDADVIEFFKGFTEKSRNKAITQLLNAFGRDGWAVLSGTEPRIDLDGLSSQFGITPREP